MDELEAGRDQGEDVPDVVEFDWIEVRSVQVPRLIGLVTDLGTGEAEVLALALEEVDCLAILDDKLARWIAKCVASPPRGTGWIVIKSKVSLLLLFYAV